MANKHPLRNRRINYRDGWFFVTFQVAHNKSVLGAIAEARCNLTPLGRRLVPLWMAMRQHHEALWTDAFVVMPNHFHAIVHIHPRPDHGPDHLSKLIGSFKSLATAVYRDLVAAGQAPDIGHSLWQESFWDDLISSHEELEGIRAYIRDNPKRWDMDRFGLVTEFSFGNLDLLSLRLHAFVASQGASSRELTPIRIRPRNLASAPAEAPPSEKPPVLSTFTSAQEREVLQRCLQANRRFVWVLPGGIPEPLEPAVSTACQAGRGLLLSPVPPGTGVNKQRAVWCNRYVLYNAQEEWASKVKPGGTLAALIPTPGRGSPTPGHGSPGPR